MAKFKVTWDNIKRYNCVAEIEAKTEQEAIDLVYGGKIWADDESYSDEMAIENIEAFMESDGEENG